MSDDDHDGLLDLATVLHQLGNELRKAGDVEDPVLDWYSATVELESVVEKHGDGGLRFYVVSAGAGATATNTVKVSVTIGPHSGQPEPGGM